MKKTIGIFGSTGSVGRQAVELVEENLAKYNVQVITANNNFKLLAEQAKKLNARMVVVVNEQYDKQLKHALRNENVEVYSGQNALIECAKILLDIHIMAIVGVAALLPVMEAIKHSKIVAIANKESLVCAGHLITTTSNTAKIIPIDSEHNAIHQVYNNKIQRIMLTASGGPFYRGVPRDNVSVAEATNHPIWKMGAKISIDSATMMNKVLEVIEAHYLFKFDMGNIDILIHPEAIIHGMVSYVDGTNIAVLSNPDMKLPISYALNWPHRGKSVAMNFSIELAKIGALSFFKPDLVQFPALRFLKTSNYVALNSANEVAVQAFVEKRINFKDIISVIDSIISDCPEHKMGSVEEILDHHQRIMLLTQQKISSCY